ncbi:MAG TPA: penicillin-binding protein 2 [Longimicrobiales bacterium]|nr:penicillin-binding protein 2 [Longimicrobiales bacterium]
MDIFHLHARQRRAHGALGAVWVLLGCLSLAFFQTQVLRNPAYAMQSDRNRLRPLTVPAPRGTIVDRAGRIVADNVPGYALSLLPAPGDSVRRTLVRLAPYLGLTEGGIAALMARRQRHPEQPLVVSTDLPFDQIAAIEERRPLFTQVLIEMQPKRNYPAGVAAAHLVGYVGEISEEELEADAFEGYRAGTLVGKAGVERQYERVLAGRAGVRYVEVDALGRIVGVHRQARLHPATPGAPMRLNIDVELQEWIARVVPGERRGAVVVLQPQTAAVLALYSSPPFDPNEFVGNVSHTRWRELREDSARRLLNRSIAGIYPPASTWKLATAAIALELGIVDPTATLPMACRGGMQYGNRYFRCWESKGHGYLKLAEAVAQSCDVYFYQVGLQIGLERLAAEGTRLGFGRATGVDLPGERAGHFPPDPAWFRRRFGRAPTEAEVLSLAIGQGPNDQTALKMAQFYAALATDGRAPAPRVAAEGATAGEPLDLRVSAASLEWLREGLRQVTAPGGTAHGSSLEHWSWMGKTGTAENPHGPDHGWFVGIAGPPDGAPEVVVSAIIEAGEHGSDVAQVAAKVADYYLRRAHGMPIDTIQTLREHWLAGRPARWAQWR